MTKLLNGQTPYYPIRAEVKYEPFTQCIYSDLGYCIIELLISDVLSMPYKQAINRFIFEPLHMKDSWIIDNPQDFNHQNFSWGHTKSGLVINRNDLVYPFSAAAGLWCTSKDLALILIEINRQIQGKGKLKINQNIFLELIKPQGCKDWSGLGFFLDVVDKQVELSSYGWGVGFQCMLVNYPIEGNGVVIMTNTDTKTHQMKGFIGEIISARF